MRTLGIDYGERRVGIAVSDPTGTIATPLKAVTVDDDASAIHAIGQICTEVEAKEIVVGLPLNMNGSSGPMAEKVTRFAKELAARTGLPVQTWDERLSTSISERVLLECDISRRRRREVRDKMAAQIILQGYLDAHSPEEDL